MPFQHNCNHVLFSSDASNEPLEAARKAHSYYYVHIIINYVKIIINYLKIIINYVFLPQVSR